MIQATVISGKPTFIASIRGIAVYLDNWALKAFAKANPQLGERFIIVIRSGLHIPVFDFSCNRSTRSTKRII